jgi:hypothetical protein
MEPPHIASECSVERPTAATPKTNAEGFEILSETLQFKRYVQVVDRIVKYPNGKEVYRLVDSRPSTTATCQAASSYWHSNLI